MTIPATDSGLRRADQRSTANTAPDVPHGGMPFAWGRCIDGKAPLGLLSPRRDLGRASEAQTAAQVRNRLATLLAFAPGGTP
jgi:hypothetical protein